MDNKFKNVNGAWLTRGLFFETCLHNEDNIMYTLKEYDHEVRGKKLPSLYKLYMEMEDPTEYEFANEYLGGWTHWKKLCDSPFFLEHVTNWREELTIKLKAKALHQIRQKAQDPDNKDNYQANKFLIDKGWEEKKKGGVGRTTKDKIKQEANKIALTQSEFDEDYNRILGASVN